MLRRRRHRSSRTKNERKHVNVNELKETIQESAHVQAENQPADAGLAPNLLEAIRQAVSQALAEEKKAWQLQAEEAQRLALLTDEEKADHLLRTREETLSAREQALTEREMRAFAREQLGKRKLPQALLDALCCKDEESCKASLEKVEKAFRSAVQQGVMERMRGQEPQHASTGSLDELDDDAYYRQTYQK